MRDLLGHQQEEAIGGVFFGGSFNFSLMGKLLPSSGPFSGGGGGATGITAAKMHSNVAVCVCVLFLFAAVNKVSCTSEF